MNAPTVTSCLSRAILKTLGCTTTVSSTGHTIETDRVPDTSTYRCPDVFRQEWLTYNLLRKREIIGSVGRIVCDTKYKDSEETCRAINRFGKRFSIIGPTKDQPYEAIISIARGLIHDCLGASVPNDWLNGIEFSGGASTSRNRSMSLPAFKWYASMPKLDVTHQAIPYLYDAICQRPQLWYRLWATFGDPATWFNCVIGGHASYVPKDATSDRRIMIEPDGNMLLQKGVGSIIRTKLLRIGINLNDQGINQLLAKIGSVTGALCTIDLASASDSISIRIVEELLPPEWYHLLMDLRSPFVKEGDEWQRIEKISAMGCGYTFELESLIFWALTRATCIHNQCSDKRIGVYGDDIICHNSYVEQLIAVLDYCGFTVNVDKSFINGPFRESCGSHYYLGADVRPVYIKKDLTCTSQLYRLYNRLRDWAGGEYFDERYRNLLDLVISHIKVKDRHFVPPSFSDVSGLKYPDVSIVNRKVCEHTLRQQLSITYYARKSIDLTSRVPDGVWYNMWASSLRRNITSTDLGDMYVREDDSWLYKRTTVPLDLV